MYTLLEAFAQFSPNLSGTTFCWSEPSFGRSLMPPGRYVFLFVLDGVARLPSAGGQSGCGDQTRTVRRRFDLGGRLACCCAKIIDQQSLRTGMFGTSTRRVIAGSPQTGDPVVGKHVPEAAR